MNSTNGSEPLQVGLRLNKNLNPFLKRVFSSNKYNRDECSVTEVNFELLIYYIYFSRFILFGRGGLWSEQIVQCYWMIKIVIVARILPVVVSALLFLLFCVLTSRQWGSFFAQCLVMLVHLKEAVVRPLLFFSPYNPSTFIEPAAFNEMTHPQ